MGKLPGKPWKIYIVSAEGGSPQTLLPGDRNEADPNWSPDGRSLIFGRPPEYMAEASAPKAIHLFDLRTKQISTLPGSNELFSPRWSPDGRFVAAMSLDQQKLMLYDFASRQWLELAKHGAHNPTWSADGKYLYFQGMHWQGDSDIYRVRISDPKVERIASSNDLQRANVAAYDFVGLAPDSSPLVVYHLANWDIYALDWQAP
jgi:Tol biopolymer transport system component